MEEPLIKNEQQENNGGVDQQKKELSAEELKKKYGYEGDVFYRANCISQMFFYWAFRLIRFANFTSLKKEYLGDAEGPNKSENFMKRLYYFWNDMGYKNKGGYKLLKTTVRANIGKSNLFNFRYR
jgi:hypothetical protein